MALVRPLDPKCREAQANDLRFHLLATPTGLEPAASAVTGRRANQLRYGASLNFLGASLREAVEL